MSLRMQVGRRFLFAERSVAMKRAWRQKKRDSMFMLRFESYSAIVLKINGGVKLFSLTIKPNSVLSCWSSSSQPGASGRHLP